MPDMARAALEFMEEEERRGKEFARKWEEDQKRRPPWPKPIWPNQARPPEIITIDDGEEEPTKEPIRLPDPLEDVRDQFKETLEKLSFPAPEKQPEAAPPEEDDDLGVGRKRKRKTRTPTPPREEERDEGEEERSDEPRKPKRRLTQVGVFTKTLRSRTVVARPDHPPPEPRTGAEARHEQGGEASAEQRVPEEAAMQKEPEKQDEPPPEGQPDAVEGGGQQFFPK
jgi:hypothetical protein